MERISQSPEPERRYRKIFLWVSAVTAVAIILASHAVLLPFVLGLVVAYVLTPAVLWVEKRWIPRWAAILLVYAVSISAVSGFLSLTVPTLVKETRALSEEIPGITRKAYTEWLPALDAKLSSWMSRPSSAEFAEPVDPTPPPLDPPEGALFDEPVPGLELGGQTKTATGTATSTGTATDTLPPVAAEPEVETGVAPLVVRPRPDGSFEVVVREGVQIRQTGSDVWRIEPAPEQPRGISSGNILRRTLDRAVSYLSTNSFEVLRFGQAVVGAISRGIFYLFLTLMLGGYLIYTHERILSFFRALWTLETQPAFDRFLHRLDRGLSGVVRGQLLICLVNGVLSAIGFWLFDLKYWPILAIIAAIGSIVPIFGSILSTIPAVLIALTQSFGTSVAVLAWVVGIHQLEANFLNPKIIGDAAKIHPVLVVFSLLVGEHYFGIAGALFAVPCLSILQTLFLHFRESTMGLRDPTATLPPTPRSSKG